MRAYNKVIRYWIDTIDGSELTPSDDWLIDPTFTDEAFAMQIGQEYWTFTGNNINTPTQDEYDTLFLLDTKATIWISIQAERDRRRKGGVLINTAAGPYWFHTDDTSRIQHIGLILMGQNLPSGIMWKTMSGAFVEMTPTIADQIFQGIAAKDIAIFTIAEQHRAAMNASSTPNTYNYLTGSLAWPIIYGE